MDEISESINRLNMPSQTKNEHNQTENSPRISQFTHINEDQFNSRNTTVMRNSQGAVKSDMMNLTNRYPKQKRSHP